MQSPNNTNTAPGYNSDFVGNEQPQYYGQLYCDPASEQATQATQQNSEAEENNANLSQISPNNLESSQNIDKNSVREQDRFLPIANISRIMKKFVSHYHFILLFFQQISRCLPQNAKISKDAKETAQECISEFIAFVTSEASDRCIQEKRKTMFNISNFFYQIKFLELIFSSFSSKNTEVGKIFCGQCRTLVLTTNVGH